MCVFIGNKKYGVGAEGRRDANIKVRQLFACRISYFSEYSIWITYARMYFIPRNQFHVLLYRAKIIINACPQLCGFEYWIYDFFYYYYFSFFLMRPLRRNYMSQFWNLWNLWYEWKHLIFLEYILILIHSWFTFT